MLTTKQITEALPDFTYLWLNEKWNLEVLCAQPIESTYYHCWIKHGNVVSWHHQLCMCLDINMNLIVEEARYTGRSVMSGGILSDLYNYKKLMISAQQLNLAEYSLPCVLDAIARLIKTPQREIDPLINYVNLRS